MPRDPRGDNPPPHPDAAGEFRDVHDARHRVLVGLSKLGVALRSEAWKDAGPRGLNPTQAQILVVLGRAALGGMRLSGIAAALAVSAPTVSDSVAALERKGLVAKDPAPDDARALAITLTPEGVAAAREISAWPDPLLGVVDVLDEEERGVFLRALVKMIRELQEAGRISPSRTCLTCRFFRPHVHADPLRPHHCAFVDASFGDRNLRLECGEHEPAEPALAEANWGRFAGSAG